MPELPPLATIALRLLGIAAGLVAWFVTQRLIGQRPLAEQTIGDRAHQLIRDAVERAKSAK